MRSMARGISVLVVFILVVHDGPFAMAQGEPDRSPRGLVRSLGNTGYRHPGAIQHACLDPTERTLFTLSEKGVYAWDLRTGESHLLFDAERVRNALSISPDGHLLASIAGDDVALWDARTGALVRSFDESDSASHVAFQPDGKGVIIFREGSIERRSVDGNAHQDRRRDGAALLAGLRPQREVVRRIGARQAGGGNHHLRRAELAEEGRASRRRVGHR